MKRKRVSITDIARELQVTPSTVSRALNGGPKIGDKTRQAILELAEKWGYRPNPFAKSLLFNKTYNIGLIIPELTHHFFNQVLSGIESITYQNGYHLIICTSDNHFHKEKKSVQTLLDMRVDGLIAAIGNESNSFDHFQEIMDIGVPFVLIDRTCEDIEASYVITNDFEGAFQAVEYLIKTGCKKIIYIKGPANISTSFNRYMGYVESLKKHHIPLEEDMVIDSSDPYRMKDELISLLKENKADAVFAHNDYLAYEVMNIIKELGLRIPENISLMGYANEPVASYISPKLSTVRQPAFDMGEKAASFLIQKMESELHDENILTECLATELVIRESTHPLDELHW